MKKKLIAFLLLVNTVAMSQNVKKNILVIPDINVSPQLNYLLKVDSLNEYNVTFFDNRGSLSDTFELFAGIFNTPNSESYKDYSHYFDTIILEEGGSVLLVSSKEDLIKSIKKYEVCLKEGGKILFISNRAFKLKYPTVVCNSVINDGYTPRFDKEICSDSLYSEKQLVGIFENKEQEIREKCNRCSVIPRRDAQAYFQKNNPTIKLWQNTGSISNTARFIDSLVLFSIITGQKLSTLKDLDFTSLKISELDCKASVNTLATFFNE